MVATRPLIAGLVAALVASSGIAVGQGANLVIIANRTLIDNEKIFGIGTVEKTRRTIADGDTLSGINSRLSKITAPSGFTGGGTFLRIHGRAQAGSATTIQLASSHDFGNDALNGYTVTIIGGTGAPQSKTITDYAGATDTATVNSSWTTNPDSTSVYVVEGGTPAVGGNAYVTTANYGTGTSGAKVQGMEIYVGHSDYGMLDETSTTDAVNLDSRDGVIENNRILWVRGTAAKVFGTLAAGTTYSGTVQIRDNDIIANHVGIETAVPDTRISGNVVTGSRDYNCKINSGDTSCISANNHYFGAGIAACYVDAAAFFSTGDEFNDAFIGLHITGNGFNASIVNPYCIHDWSRSMLLEAQCTIEGGKIQVPQADDDHPDIIGVEIASNWVSLIGLQMSNGYHQFPDPPGPPTYTYVSSDAMIRINDEMDNVTIRDVRLDGHSTTLANQIGILIVGETRNTTIDVTGQLFDNSGDVLVKCATNEIYGCTFIIRAAGTTLTQNLFSIPSGWGNRGNRIILIDDDGVRTELNTTTGAAYP